MAAPTLTATLNASAYKPGDPMILTVNYSDPDTKAVTLSIIATDSTGAKSQPVTVTAVIDPTDISVTDSSGRVWTQQAGSVSPAIFKATA